MHLRWAATVRGGARRAEPADSAGSAELAPDLDEAVDALQGRCRGDDRADGQARRWASASPRASGSIHGMSTPRAAR